MTPVFEYEARSRNGEKISGSLEAEDSNQLAHQLRDKGYIVTSIEERKEKKDISEYLSFGKRRVKTSDLTLFSQQFSAMIDAGISLVQALEIMQDQTDHPRLREVLREIQEDVETGSNLSEAMGRHPDVFPDLYVQMIKAGESGGVLDKVLSQLSEHYERQDEINSKIKSALYYPITILIVAVLVVIFLVTNVVPQFVSMFAGFGATLPLPTRILLAISNFMQHFWWLLLLLIFAIIFITINLYKTPRGERFFDNLILKIPVVGKMMHQVLLSRFSSTLAILLESGVDLLSSLTIVEDVVGNRIFAEILTEARTRVREGIAFSQPLSEARLIPNMVVQMIKVGEEAGTMEAMLKKIAAFYDREVEASVEGTISLIEPVMIVFLAIIVGFIVISIVMPMFDMFQHF